MSGNSIKSPNKLSGRVISTPVSTLTFSAGFIVTYFSEKVSMQYAKIFSFFVCFLSFIIVMILFLDIVKIIYSGFRMI